MSLSPYLLYIFGGGDKLMGFVFLWGGRGSSKTPFKHLLCVISTSMGISTAAVENKIIQRGNLV